MNEWHSLAFRPWQRPPIACRMKTPNLKMVCIDVYDQKSYTTLQTSILPLFPLSFSSSHTDFSHFVDHSRSLQVTIHAISFG